MASKNSQSETIKEAVAAAEEAPTVNVEEAVASAVEA